ncbi:MAG TPA: PqqD family protein [Chloroflexota bacterium]|nr:PqqD family protein [Chloroflexota bacterium]HUM69709.1 PqqD family protein [Chloroflexota bacterium]
MTADAQVALPQMAPGLIWRVVDDNIVVVSPEAGDVHVLSRTGSDIWQLLAGSKDVSTIESYLVQKYIVSAEQAHQDVANFIQELKALGLLH